MIREVLALNTNCWDIIYTEPQLAFFFAQNTNYWGNWLQQTQIKSLVTLTDN